MADLTERAKAQLAESESFAKPITPILAAATSTGTVILVLIGVLTDIYKFFDALICFTVIACVVTVLLALFRTRKSKLAGMEDIGVPRFGKSFVWASTTVSLTGLIGIGVMALFFGNDLFDPIVTNHNDSPLSIDSFENTRSMSSVSRFFPVEGATPEELALLKQGLDGASQNVNTPDARPMYTFTFDVTLKGRFEWVKIERVVVKLLSIRPIPLHLRAVNEVGHTFVRSPLEFRTAVSKAAATKSPIDLAAEFVQGPVPRSKRGSIVIDDHKPVGVYIDVYFDADGVFELVPELTVSDGWRKRTIVPCKSVLVVSKKLTKEEIDRQRFPPASAPHIPEAPVSIPKPAGG